MRRCYRGLLLILLLKLVQCWLQTPSRTVNKDFPSRVSPFLRRLGGAASPSQFETDSELFDLNLLIIDHYDSFTYNLADYFTRVCTEAPLVMAADSADSWQELLRSGALQSRNWTKVDGVVLSPGPGSPELAGGLSADLIRSNPHLAIFGVCLGHQILGKVYGAHVELAPEPVHGQVRSISILDRVDPLWRGVVDGSDQIPPRVAVTRYHSLVVSNLANGTQLISTSCCRDFGQEVIMSMRHTQNPHFGVQFHPESIGTAVGMDLVRNFCGICRDHSVPVQLTDWPLKDKKPVLWDNSLFSSTMRKPRYEVFAHKVGKSSLMPEDVMRDIVQRSNAGFTFWLDEATASSDQCSLRAPATSILGSGTSRIEYWGKEKAASTRGLRVWLGDGEMHSLPNEDVLSYLKKQYSSPIRQVNLVHFGEDDSLFMQSRPEVSSHVDLPFSFRGGHVGYLGYEVRHDTTRFLEEQEQGQHASSSDTTSFSGDENVPTSAFIWADRTFVFDHEHLEWYLIGVVSDLDPTSSKEAVLEWIRTMATTLRAPHRGVSQRLGRNGYHVHSSTTTFRPNRSRRRYSENFAQCRRHIRQGDSYELCLTNQLETQVPRRHREPLELYRILRQRNPAPYCAFFDWNSRGLDSTTQASLAICCSSPERFISVDRKTHNGPNGKLGPFRVQAKPIKGTCARVQDRSTAAEERLDQERAKALQASPKNRAENLMIVDLLRNDLSRVCRAGTVQVSNLWGIESFATVHQLVSTIQGELDCTKTAVDVLMACFPGGSMTGAPKLRTMEILDELEEGASRGVYSGSLGYLSLNGCMDMNIVIRTAVLVPTVPTPEMDEWKVSVGAGGAITILSENEDEYEEMLLKASAVVNAVEEWASGVPPKPNTVQKEACMDKEKLSRSEEELGSEPV